MHTWTTVRVQTTEEYKQMGPEVDGHVVAGTMCRTEMSMEGKLQRS